MTSIIKHISILLMILSIFFTGCSRKSFFDALEAGDVQAVSQYVAQNPQLLQQKNIGGLLPMQVAAKGGHIKMLQWLMDRGLPIDEPTSKEHNGLTSFYIAVALGHIEAAHFLLEKGADVNGAVIGPRYYASPLNAAVYDGDVRMVQFLLDHGITVNITNKNYKHPIITAVSMGKTQIVKMLLDKGADVNTYIESGRTLLFVAFSNEQPEMMALLLSRGADVNHLDNSGCSVLHMIQYWRRENPQFVWRLLSSGVDVNTVANDGSTPLHWAAAKRFTRVAQLLLAYGARTDKTDKMGDTPLAWAKREGALGVCKHLLALHQATAAGDRAQVQKLLRTYPTLVYSRDEAGKTPLHVAAETNQTDIAALLLKAGAEIDTQTVYKQVPLAQGVVAQLIVPEVGLVKRFYYKKTALDIAMERHNQEMVNLLQGLGQK